MGSSSKRSIFGRRISFTPLPHAGSSGSGESGRRRTRFRWEGEHHSVVKANSFARRPEWCSAWSGMRSLTCVRARLPVAPTQIVHDQVDGAGLSCIIARNDSREIRRVAESSSGLKRPEVRIGHRPAGPGHHHRSRDLCCSVRCSAVSDALVLPSLRK